MVFSAKFASLKQGQDVMALQKEELDDVTSECSSYDKRELKH